MVHIGDQTLEHLRLYDNKQKSIFLKLVILASIFSTHHAYLPVHLWARCDDWKSFDLGWDKKNCDPFIKINLGIFSLIQCLPSSCAILARFNKGRR